MLGRWTIVNGPTSRSDLALRGVEFRELDGTLGGEQRAGEGDTTVKVVIFCGGMGVRMGEATQTIPKPMIQVGPKPILWHIMKWYASWGHTDFILCLGYKADRIKHYFLTYHEALGNDFVLSNGGNGSHQIELLGENPDEMDVKNWRITFVDTGVHSVVGERLKVIEPYVADEPLFLATYGDGLTDAPLDDMIERIDESGKTGLFISVTPRVEYHVVDADEDGVVRSVEHLPKTDVRINGGFFVFRQGIFDVLGPGEDLVNEPFARLIAQEELLAYRYEGFWEPMDTMKDKQKLDALYEGGSAPWRIRTPAHR
jgi:glucose-1-phosphate cytidylyltransferase